MTCSSFGSCLYSCSDGSIVEVIFAASTGVGVYRYRSVPIKMIGNGAAKIRVAGLVPCVAAGRSGASQWR
jgi:hypothetical protein